MKTFRLLFGVLVFGFFPYAALVGFSRSHTTDWPRLPAWLLSDLLPVGLALVGIVLAERMLSGGSWTDGLRRLGLGRPNVRVFVAGFLAGLPALVGILIQVSRPQADRTLASSMTFIRVVLAQALFEELLFRGFAFRRLNERIGFRRAAIAAAIVFGLCHAGNLFFRTISGEMVAQVAIQIVLTTMLAFAPTFLLRRSRGLLWGACLWHLMLDVGIFFPNAAPDAISALPSLLGSLLTVPAAWAVARWFLPENTTSSAADEAASIDPRSGASLSSGS